MESGDIYIFDESSPLLESRRNILFNDDRTHSILTPTYLVELPEYMPNAPVPPSALLEKRRRSRGTSIINPQLQLELTEQEQEQPLEHFMTENLTNYRRSMLVKDPDETHGIITAENRDNEVKFEIIEPLQISKAEKVPLAYLGNSKTEQTRDTTPQEIVHIKKLSYTNNYNDIQKEENNSLKSEGDVIQRSHLSPKKENMREVADNSFAKVTQKSPFTYDKSDFSNPMPSRLKITLMLIASEENLGSLNNHDNLLGNDVIGRGQQFENNFRDEVSSKHIDQSSFADSGYGNTYSAEKRYEKSDQQTKPPTKFKLSKQKSSNLQHNKPHKPEIQLQKSICPYRTDLNEVQEKRSEDGKREKSLEDRKSGKRSEDKKREKWSEERKREKSSEDRNRENSLEDRMSGKRSEDRKREKSSEDRKREKRSEDRKREKSSEDRKRRKRSEDRKREKRSEDRKREKRSEDRRREKSLENRKSGKRSEDRKREKSSENRKRGKSSEDRKRGKSSEDRKRGKSSEDRKREKRSEDRKREKRSVDRKREKSSEDRKREKISEDREIEKRSADTVSTFNNQKTINVYVSHQTDKHPKSAKKIVCSKRYHVQLLKRDKQDKWFNMCFAIDKCDVEMKYKGPVKITKYYSTNKYKL